MSNKKVLVSGCYDLLHSGHIAFFKDAARYGDLYVSVGSDENIRLLKDHGPHFSQQERIYIDRKSTRLNSSHKPISYAVFCLKKKKQQV